MLSLATVLTLLPSLALASPLNLADRDLAKRYTAAKIQANRDGMCLHVYGRNGYFDGTPVVSVDCSVASTWDIKPGSGSIILHDHPESALDAGSNQSNNGRLKVIPFPSPRLVDTDGSFGRATRACISKLGILPPITALPLRAARSVSIKAICLFRRSTSAPRATPIKVSFHPGQRLNATHGSLEYH